MLPKSPAAEPQWPPRSPHDVLLSTPGGRARLRRMASQASPSPLRTRAVDSRSSFYQDEDEDEDEDEETLQLKLQEIQAKLRLKKLQAAKANKSASESGGTIRSTEPPSTPAIRTSKTPLLQRPRSPPQSAVEVPASPVRRAQPAEAATLAAQKSPRRVLLGIDKGLRGQDVSLKRPPASARRGLGLMAESAGTMSSGSSAAASTPREPRQQESRPLSFNERLAAARVQETALRDRKEKIQKLRSEAFSVGKEEVEVYKSKAVDIPAAPEKPQQYSREDIIGVAIKGKKPPGEGHFLHRSRTMPNLRSSGDDGRGGETNGPTEAAAEAATAITSTPTEAANGGVAAAGGDLAPSFEPYSGFHLSRRILPHTVVARAVAGKTIYMLQDLLRDVKAPNFDLPDVETDVVVLAIVASKSDPRSHKPVGGGGGPDSASSSSSPSSSSAAAAAKKKEEERGKYMVVTLVDLTYQIDLFLFKSGFDRYWKLSTGTVVAILNPVVMPPPPGRHDTGRWGLVINSDADTILEIGTARDLGYCKSVKKDGQLCSDWVNAKRTEFCEFHTNEAVRRMRATRNEINGAAGFGGARHQQDGRGGRGGRGGHGGHGGRNGGWSGREPTSNTGYDWSSRSRYFMAGGGFGGASASSLMDGDGGGYADKVERQEGIKRRLAAKEKETDIARKLGELGSGAGRDYMQLTARDRVAAAVARSKRTREANASQASTSKSPFSCTNGTSGTSTTSATSATTVTTGMTAADQIAASRASLLASVATRRGAGGDATAAMSSAARPIAPVIHLSPPTKRKRSQSALSSLSSTASSAGGGGTEPARDRMAGLGWGSNLRNKLGRMKEGEKLAPATKSTKSVAEMLMATEPTAAAAAAAAAASSSSSSSTTTALKKDNSPERSPVRKKTRFLLGGKGIREAGRESLGAPVMENDDDDELIII